MTDDSATFITFATACGFACLWATYIVRLTGTGDMRPSLKLHLSRRGGCCRCYHNCCSVVVPLLFLRPLWLSGDASGGGYVDVD